MVYYLDGRKMTDKETAHAYLAETMSFPSYYGKNLDALHDMLTGWMQGTAVLKYASSVKENLGDYGEILLKVFHDSAEECSAFQYEQYEGEIIMKQVISTAGAPGAIGPYSQAICANGFVFVSGQLPVDPATGAFPSDDIGELTAMSIRNIEAILKEAGCTLDDVVKTTVFLQDMNDFVAMNKVYAEYFKADCPARSAVQVAKLPKAGKIEIEAIAVKP